MLQDEDIVEEKEEEEDGRNGNMEISDADQAGLRRQRRNERDRIRAQKKRVSSLKTRFFSWIFLY